jgi:hypothetical protein
MKFVQKEDSSCDIIFEEHEIKIIKEKNKLHLPPETLKHFGNVITKIVMDWNINFNDEIKKLQTENDTRIKGK